MIAYKVRWNMDKEYIVVVLEAGKYIYDPSLEQVFQGSLADCEAWIRLKTEGHLD